ncbi:MAG TPA: DHH family phosphoesterase [Erysipelothrix sp.]|nr:DHH family phosphoesterase [Erysipelothrix sp.]
MARFEKYKTQLLVLGFVEIIVLLIVHFLIPEYLTIVQYVIILINLLLVFIIYATSVKAYKERVLSVTRTLGKESGEAFSFARLALLTYDDEFNISWMSEVFDDYGLNCIGRPLLEVFPELSPIMGKLDESVFVDVKEVTFKASHLSSKGVIAFLEQTEIGKLHQRLDDSSAVLGFAYLDNYEETTAYEDENTIAQMDTNIREAVVKWANDHHVMIRRLRPDRYLLLLNDKIFKTIEKEKFTILNTVRQEASKIDARITVSMSFARKTENYKELEEMANRALELAQSRGGDQVAINTKGESMRYYGGTVEAIEKRSKVRVRVTAQNLGSLIEKAENVLIVGHQMMDFDCMGSALGVSAIVQGYNKPCSIILDVDDIEAKLSETIKNSMEEFTQDHNFVSPTQALDIINDNTLVIMVDHHNDVQTQVPKILEVAHNIVVIDHHRRTGEFNFKPKLTYIEPSASSASELVIELFPYHKEKISISPFAATIMYTGILIDTNRFRNRTGSRTFETLAELRKYGAAITEVENFLRDEYEDFELKNKVLNQSELYSDGYVIAAFKDGNLRRALMSQVADEILKVRNVEASFVVSNISEDTVAISSRSSGDLNVQRVMEILGGGGHFTGAAAQIKNQNINEVVENLKEAIDTVRKEVN